MWTKYIIRSADSQNYPVFFAKPLPLEHSLTNESGKEGMCANTIREMTTRWRHHTGERSHCPFTTIHCLRILLHYTRHTGDLRYRHLCCALLLSYFWIIQEVCVRDIDFHFSVLSFELWFWCLMRLFSLSRLSLKYVDGTGDGEFDITFW